ncbi:MAG: DUF4350 domain-containing protein [Demequinaceae bacterium]|nr:DUF4350 domain-containing protein [Demequinaceae bacterium]
MTATDIARVEGYTIPEPGPALKSRLWRLRYWIVVALAFVAIVALALARATPSSSEALSTWNPEPDGSMAVAEILRDQGVRIREIGYLSRALISDPDATTFVITLPSMLSDDQIASVLEHPGDLVFIGISRDLLQALGDGLSYWTDQGYAFSAACDDPDAIAAEFTTASSPRIGSDRIGGTTVCFQDPNGYGTYAVIDQYERRIILITDPVIAMNENLSKEGNAALVLRALGKHRTLVWYSRALDDDTTLVVPGAPGNPGGPPPREIEAQPGYLPTGTGDALFALGLAGLVAAFWRGRRMGALVSEPLPVIVHASESARGRGRLYRRAKSTGRASAALRAAAAERMGRRLGVPRSAEPPALIAAVSRASNREAAAVERLLYGPPPTTEPDMMVLAKELDTLEREVERP